ncbi:MAG: IS4 family transposase [Cetobacterium sp.]|uniref:IS4 family transposase n=1 Tax=Cetobacterium sp. TaxID=2071632 RepID=UPI003F2C4CDB
MHERLKHLIQKSKELFSLDFIEKLSKKSKFIKRKGKITADKFMAFTVFSGEDLCIKSLASLCARLEVQFGIVISPQSLNERFNDDSVNFLQELFKAMLMNENNLFQSKNNSLSKIFKRILVADSTVFTLPEKFYKEFKGAGNEQLGSAVKIQLQFDLLSGNFTCCEVQEGIIADASYTKTMLNVIEAKDLSLADLGYFKSDFLNKINEKGAYYISKIKSNTRVYIKNPNPEFYKTTGNIKKSTEFIKVDIYESIKNLREGETIELKDVFIGSEKELKPRLILTKLDKAQTEKRANKLLKNVKKKRGTFNERSISWNCLNAYITNIDDSTLATEEIHLFYSLRWQVELMFKIWKSIFKIHQVKKVKIQRFKCFLYGRLIALLFSSNIVYTAKEISLETKGDKISNHKAFDKVIEYFPLLRHDIFKGELVIGKSLKRLIEIISRLAKKSKRKGSITTTEILSLLIKPQDCPLKLAI